MRMKMFSARTLEDARAMIHAEMGADAVILSERVVEDGVEVRAATDKMGGGMVPNEPLFMSRFAHDDAPMRPQDHPLRSRVRDALSWHGAPTSFARKVADAAMARAAGETDPQAVMELGLAQIVTCQPLSVHTERNILLVGAPGHGRTAVAAKLARRASVARAVLKPLAADLDDTGGGAQLAAFLEQERSWIHDVRTPDALFDALRGLRHEGARCVIDLPAIVPFDMDDMASLQDLIAAIDAEPVLVLSSEGHPDDQSEAVRAFARLGVKRAILTKLDVARRRGGAVAALAASGIAISHLSVTPFIGGGLVPAAASRLAALLMEDAPGQVALKGAA